jgi:hypothetical protein
MMLSCSCRNDKKSTREQLGLNLSPTDITYILRITSLILRRGRISTVLNNNIYFATSFIRLSSSTSLSVFAVCCFFVGMRRTVTPLEEYQQF